MADPITQIAESDAVETVESLAEDITDSVSPVIDYGHALARRFIEQFSGVDGLIALAILLGVGLTGFVIRRPVGLLVDQLWPTIDRGRPFLGNLKNVVHRVAVPLVLAMLLWVAIGVLRELGVVNEVLRVVASMLQGKRRLRPTGVQLDGLKFHGRSSSIRCAGWPAAIASSVALR